MQFEEMNIIPSIIEALEKEGYEHPTPIQKEAIPIILSGRDLLGCAQTGTGKTAAFAIPIIQQLNEEKVSHKTKGNIRALIVTPTRELALQIYDNFNTYGQFTNLKCCVVFGGVSQKQQEQDLMQHVDILVATPGRLLALMDEGVVNIEHIKILVMDEADRMLDMGFINDVKKIIKKTPLAKQTLLFSATMPPNIAKLANSILKNPQKVEVTPVSSAVDIIEQYLYYVDKKNKRDLLFHILKDKSITSVLVFARTKHGADRIAKQLVKHKVKAQAIHGDKSQGARQRALNEFKDKTLRVLIATDIAARGIDINELSYVINFDLPNTPETYVHRIGRTGRAGHEGVAISFCDFDEKEQLVEIERLIERKLIEVKEHPYPLEDNFPAVKATQPKRDTSVKSQIESPKKKDWKSKGGHKTVSSKSKVSSKKNLKNTDSRQGKSDTKKKFRMTSDGTLKEIRKYNKSR
ncbi:DEAD/DEAH box helicase [Anaerosporobacter sp.]|uniref:DEAD/DEAH box helicase n=1 Tax=Anaerosporobacter sp. TaxID=1872529 RepID=UPI00286EF033|nr:DEAD/DEAH box helicase [Anaerosporobacter sp.]